MLIQGEGIIGCRCAFSILFPICIQTMGDGKAWEDGRAMIMEEALVLQLPHRESQVLTGNTDLGQSE